MCSRRASASLKFCVLVTLLPDWVAVRWWASSKTIKSHRWASRMRFTRLGRLSVSMLAISRLCLAKALLLRSVTSPSLPKTSKSRWKVSFSSRRQLLTRPAGTIIMRPGQFAAGSKLSEDKGDFDRLSQAHAVGDQESPGRCVSHAIGQHDLVRQQVHLGGGQGRSTIHQGELLGLQGQP